MSYNLVDPTTGDLTRVAGGTLFADTPIGTISPFGGSVIPSGYFLCNGQAVSRTTYADLFAVIGTSFGTGDGSTTFNLPDLRETVPVGIGENDVQTIANHDVYTLGEFKDDNLGKHDHNLIATTKATFNNAGVPVGISNNNTPTTATHGKQLGVNYIIKAKMIALPTDLASGVEELINTENILWENQSPNSGFSAQNVTLANDNYKYLTIYYKEYVERNCYLSVKFPKGAGCYLNKIDCSSIDYYVYNRICEYRNSTKLYFDDAYQSTQAVANNGHLIPIKIVGSMT